jgi:hypothetical protein
MRQSFFHLSRDSARMFSGAAGLIAGFIAVSLPILVFQDAAGARIMRLPTIIVPALMLGLGLLASGLLRFSLMRDDPASEVRSPGLTPGIRSVNMRKHLWK